MTNEAGMINETAMKLEEIEIGKQYCWRGYDQNHHQLEEVVTAIEITDRKARFTKPGEFLGFQQVSENDNKLVRVKRENGKEGYVLLEDLYPLEN